MMTAPPVEKGLLLEALKRVQESAQQMEKALVHTGDLAAFKDAALDLNLAEINVSILTNYILSRQ